MAPVVVRRPLLAIQCDWNEVLSEKDGNAWVSCKEYGSSSKHGKLHSISAQENNSFYIQASGSFKVENVTKYSIIVLHEDPNCRCSFFSPNKSLSSVHQKSVVGLDVTSGGLGVSVCSENKLCIWDSSTGVIRRHLKGHVWDVYTSRFFPSGSVILSSGADMQLKIWSAETAQCATTLTGHSAAISDAAIVDRGRNVVSVSKDGTARLWDCGKSACLDVIVKDKGIINCCSLGAVNIDLGVPDSPPSEREIATEGKLLVIGCENGSVEGIGLQSRKSLFEFKTVSAVNCCCFVSPHKAAFGTQGGKVFLLDIRNPSEFCMVWEESASTILCLLPTKNGLFAGKADGTCIFIPFDNDKSVQLTGPGFDPVYCMASDGTSIFTGCRDGQIRKYTLPISTGITLL